MARLPGRNTVELVIGTVKLIATTIAGGNNDRRIAKYSAIGVNGAELEDLGQDENQDAYTANVSESVYLQLKTIKEAGKAVTIVHPLFGTYQGRLVSCKYAGTTRSGLDISLVILEDGAAANSTLKTTPANLPAWDGKAKAAWSDASDSLTSLAVLPDMPDDILAGIDGLVGSWNAFSDVVSLVQAGAAAAGEIAYAFSSLSTSVTGMMNLVDNAWGVVEGISDVALEDTLFPLVMPAGTWLTRWVHR